VPAVTSSSPCGSSSHLGPLKPLHPQSSAFSHSHCATAARLHSRSQGQRVSSTRCLPRYSLLLFLFLFLIPSSCLCLLPELVSRSPQIPQWGILLPGSPSFLIRWLRCGHVHVFRSKCPTSSSDREVQGKFSWSQLAANSHLVMSVWQLLPWLLTYLQCCYRLLPPRLFANPRNGVVPCARSFADVPAFLRRS